MWRFRKLFRFVQYFILKTMVNMWELSNQILTHLINIYIFIYLIGTQPSYVKPTWYGQYVKWICGLVVFGDLFASRFQFFLFFFIPTSRSRSNFFCAQFLFLLNLPFSAKAQGAGCRLQITQGTHNNLSVEHTINCPWIT